MSEARVLIVGGGIGGLATAAGLRQAGIRCEVVERTPRFAPVGAGIVMGVNAMSVLRGIGVADRVVASGARLGRGAITDAAGRPLSSSDFGILEPEFGPTIALHRAALHEVLLEAAGDVPITLDTTVAALRPQADRVDVRLSNGREASYDLVIGADGLRSGVRELTLGAPRIAYAGYTCWRFVVKAPFAQTEMREMWGRGRRFGVVPIGDGKIYCFAVANAPRGEADPAPGRLERFRARFAEFGGQVPAILAALDPSDALIHNDLEEIPERRWFAGRVALVGDAAHAMTPNMGQGAAMALEDSAVLVRQIRSGAPLPEALAAYRSQRDARVAWVQRQSRRIGRVGHWDGALACRLRNALLRRIPDSANAGALQRIARQPIHGALASGPRAVTLPQRETRPEESP